MWQVDYGEGETEDHTSREEAEAAADAVAQAEERTVVVAQQAMGQGGASFKDIYWTVGPYDLVGILEAPDDETATAALLSVAGQGNIRTTTLRAFKASEMRSVIEKAT